MHALEVIIARNAYAAGREAAHADNDANRLVSTSWPLIAETLKHAQNIAYVGWRDGYRAGRQEG